VIALDGRRRAFALMGLVAAAALVLTATGSRVASSQQTTLTALAASGDVPVKEPWDPFWDEVPAVEIPLSAQAAVPPAGGRSLSANVRSVHDDENLYVAVEWGDPSVDSSVGAPQDFTDAVAVQFPSVPGETIPAFCMGDPNAGVNIWQWRAAWQADMESGFRSVKQQYPNADVDMYPFSDEDLFYPGRAAGNPFSKLDRTSPVDNLIANGFGTLTADDGHEVQGWGAWRDGTWRVIFARPMQVNADGVTDFGPIDRTNVAVAVWDGEAEERDGMKSVGNFVSMEILPDQLEAASGSSLTMVAVVLVGIWGVLALMILTDLPRPKRTSAPAEKR
jgi:hypothetical protein